jgi:hypothetical protein
MKHIITDDGTILEYSGVSVSREASYLFSDQELVSLLRSRGVDLTRPTRMVGGSCYYIITLKLA